MDPITSRETPAQHAGRVSGTHRADGVASRGFDRVVRNACSACPDEFPAPTRGDTAGLRLRNSGVKRCTHRYNGDVAHLDPTLAQKFFDVAVGEPLPQIPPEGDDDDLGREPKTLER